MLSYTLNLIYLVGEYDPNVFSISPRYKITISVFLHMLCSVLTNYVMSSSDCCVCRFDMESKTESRKFRLINSLCNGVSQELCLKCHCHYFWVFFYSAASLISPTTYHPPKCPLCMGYFGDNSKHILFYK